MEWTFGWWQICVQRVYPTTQQLSQTYNQAASWWHLFRASRAGGFRYGQQPQHSLARFDRHE
jgi:hypothetical protein